MGLSRGDPSSAGTHVPGLAIGGTMCATFASECPDSGVGSHSAIALRTCGTKNNACSTRAAYTKSEDVGRSAIGLYTRFSRDDCLLQIVVLTYVLSEPFPPEAALRRDLLQW